MNSAGPTIVGYPLDVETPVGNQFKKTRVLKNHWGHIVGHFQRPFTGTPPWSRRRPFIRRGMTAVVDCIAMTGMVSFAALVTWLLGS